MLNRDKAFIHPGKSEKKDKVGCDFLINTCLLTPVCSSISMWYQLSLKGKSQSLQNIIIIWHTYHVTIVFSTDFYLEIKILGLCMFSMSVTEEMTLPQGYVR